MLGVKHPLRWGMAAIASLVGLGLLAESEVTGGLAEALFELVTEGPLGIEAAVGGGVAEEVEGAPPPPGTSTSMLVIWYTLPNLSRYLPAALLWGALGAVSLTAAAWRHRER